MRRLRRLLIGCALLGAVVFAIKVWLDSATARRFIAGQVSEAIGATVTIDELRVGWATTLASKIALPDWASADSAVVSLSLPQLVTRNLQGEIALSDIKARLTFDKNNDLITKLPKPRPTKDPMPRLRFERASLTLAEHGKPPETFRNISGELHEENGQIKVSATADDPDWGPWSGTGLSTPDGGFHLTLKTTRPVHVSPELLRRVPFVQPSVWDIVSLEGDTPAEVLLRFSPGKRVSYRVTLEPKNTKVFVSTIDLSASAAQGKVEIEDGVVTLRDVFGKAAGGVMGLASTMDFRGEGSNLKFAIQASDMTLGLLPERWRLRRGPGSLSGTANLEVITANGQTTTRGSGAGEVRPFPLLPPLKIRMQADGSGYSFDIGL